MSFKPSALVDDTNPLPVTLDPVTPMTDRSGTITAGGSAQTLMADNVARRGFWVQNQSGVDLWMSGLGAAAAGQPSLRIPPYALYEAPLNGVVRTALSIYGAVTGQSFSAREW